jgi:hypothetical protein
MRVPLILIVFFVLTFGLELIVYFAKFREMADGLEMLAAFLGEETNIHRNFMIKQFQRLIWSVMFYGYVFLRFRQYKDFAVENSFL